MFLLKLTRPIAGLFHRKPYPREDSAKGTEMGIELMVSIWPMVDYKSENFEEMKAKGLLTRVEKGVRIDNVYMGNTIQYDPTNPIGFLNLRRRIARRDPVIQFLRRLHFPCGNVLVIIRRTRCCWKNMCVIARTCLPIRAVRWRWRRENSSPSSAATTRPLSLQNQPSFFLHSETVTSLSASCDYHYIYFSE